MLTLSLMVACLKLFASCPSIGCVNSLDAWILVSNTRNPVSYVNLAKRFLQEHGEVCISALGIAVSPAVTVAEILKHRNLASEKQIETSLEAFGDLPRTRQKPKIDIVLVKTPKFDDIIAAESQPLAPTDDHTASAAPASEIAKPSQITADGQIGPLGLLGGPSGGGPLAASPLADGSVHAGPLKNGTWTSQNKAPADGQLSKVDPDSSDH